MKIYMMADMEGASGIACREQTDPDHSRYAEGRRLLTGDVNAAVRGAFDGGASEVVVSDTHGGSFNLLSEELDTRAKLHIGGPQQGPRMAYLDDGFSGLFLIAYHAMAGTLHATLEHTMSSGTWHSVRVNGMPIGEVGIDAGIAAAAGVPTVLVTGDDKVCAEAYTMLGSIETACVKEGLGRHHALCLSQAVAQERIYAAARKAVERLAAGQSFSRLAFKEPVTISITYKHTEDTDIAAASIHTRRVDGYTVEETFDTFADWYGGLWTGRVNGLDD